MKKSLLVWGALIVVALCFVGCCYYTTNHCSPCDKHCHHKPGCKAGNCLNNNAANQDGTVETVTVEAVELVPIGNDAPAAKKTDGNSGNAAKDGAVKQPAASGNM
ncbi:MAG: hypothetical protein E7043_05105 [Lentisphaerae bacterium]|nr:hypothetical protein [Lentisphaerota bacterium]